MNIASSGSSSQRSSADWIADPRKSCWDVEGTTRFTDVFLQRWAGLTGLRADGFYWIFEALERMNKTSYNIVETGCMRKKYRELDFERDGCSTLLFDRFVQKMGGDVYSIDSNRDALHYASQFISNQTLLMWDESVKLLGSLFKSVRQIDLLYLDSMDYDKANPEQSERHHLFELTAAGRHLWSGSIVVVDDNYADGTGKGRLVRQFFTAYNLQPAFEGRQLGWIMP